MKKLRISKEKGIALLVALLVVLVLLALGGVYLLISQTTIKQTTLDEGYVSSLSIAEAGAERAIWKIKNEWVNNNLVWTTGFGCETSPVEIKDGNVKVGSYYVYVEDLGRSTGFGGTQTRKLKITSTGRKGKAGQIEIGSAVRGVEVIAELIGEGPLPATSDVFDYAYFLNNWGWWHYGGGNVGQVPREWVRGDMRSNGRFDFWPAWSFNQAPRVDGHVYANLAIDERFNYTPYHSHLRGAAGTSDKYWSIFTLPGQGEIVYPPRREPENLPYQHPNAGKGHMPNLQNPQYYRDLATGTLKAYYPDEVTIYGIYGDDETYKGVPVQSIVLEGRPTKPIELNGNVYVERDVIIKGDVIGQGAIYAGRNIYIADNIVYKNPPIMLDDTAIAGYFPKTTQANYFPSETEIFAWQQANACKDILALASRESIVLGDYTHSRWYSDSWLFGMGSEDVGKDGIPDTDDEGEDDGQFGKTGWDKNYEDIDEDGVFDCVHNGSKGQNYNWSDVTVTGQNSKSSDSLNYPGKEFGNRGSVNQYSRFSPYSVAQIDGICYTQHFIGGILNNPVSNGALISKDEAMVYWTKFIWNYDYRIHSRYRNDPNWPINLSLPPTQGGITTASINIISWKEVKP
ncbi:MAG: hypothetical protein QME42_07335 [bacterium]|nr:hypothetical protein [bacterium]